MFLGTALFGLHRGTGQADPGTLLRDGGLLLHNLSAALLTDDLGRHGSTLRQWNWGWDRGWDGGGEHWSTKARVGFGDRLRIPAAPGPDRERCGARATVGGPSVVPSAHEGGLPVAEVGYACGAGGT